MIRSPSRFTSRKFLKYLIENNFIAASGVEYCESEVKDLYYQKLTTIGEAETKKKFKEQEDKDIVDKVYELECQIHQLREDLVSQKKLIDRITSSNYPSSSTPF